MSKHPSSNSQNPRAIGEGQTERISHIFGGVGCQVFAVGGVNDPLSDLHEVTNEGADEMAFAIPHRTMNE